MSYSLWVLSSVLWPLPVLDQRPVSWVTVKRNISVVSDLFNDSPVSDSLALVDEGGQYLYHRRMQLHLISKKVRSFQLFYAINEQGVLVARAVWSDAKSKVNNARNGKLWWRELPAVLIAADGDKLWIRGHGGSGDPLRALGTVILRIGSGTGTVFKLYEKAAIRMGFANVSWSRQGLVLWRRGHMKVLRVPDDVGGALPLVEGRPNSSVLFYARSNSSSDIYRVWDHGSEVKWEKVLPSTHSVPEGWSADSLNAGPWLWLPDGSLVRTVSHSSHPGFSTSIYNPVMGTWGYLVGVSIYAHSYDGAYLLVRSTKGHLMELVHIKPN